MMCGSAAGNRNLMKTCTRDACMVVARSMRSGSMDFKPTNPETTTGKNAMSAAITTFGEKPKPSHTTNSGCHGDLRDHLRQNK